MLKFEKNVEDRKELVKRLGELTSIRPVYMRTPTYAFVCGEYTVDREGNLLVDEEAANADILTALMEEGLITGGEVVEDSDRVLDTTVEEATVVEMQDTDAGDEALESGSEVEAAAETEESADTGQPEDVETETGEAQESDENEESVESEEPESVENTETEEATDAPEPPAETAIDLNMAFPIPIGRHTGTSLRNLVNLIYSRGALINKATDGHFRVDEELVEALKDDSCAFSKANFLRAVADYEDQHGKSIYGLTFTPEEIQFTGFGEAADEEHLTAYGQLAVLMNEQALSQKRIQAKEVNINNEKYAMRIWLVRIGMDGPEFKRARAILMENLSGHTAFRTPEDAEKARAKNQQKRDALRAAKAAAATEARLDAEISDPDAEQAAEAAEDAAYSAEPSAMMEA